MKFPSIALASSSRAHISATAITLCLVCVLFLAGCEDVKIPNLSHHDEVPTEAKEAPRLVQRAPPVAEDAPWPRLGDVPFKPKDFSTKPVYEHYMDELEFHRAEAQDEKKRVEGEAPASEEK